MAAPNASRGDRLLPLLALLVGALLPVEVIDGIPLVGLEVARVVGLLAVAACFRARLSPAVARWVLAFSGLMALLAVLRLLFTVPRDDVSAAASFFGITVVAVVAATLVAYRVGAHRQLLVGFLWGASLSAAVAVAQALDLPSPRALVLDNDRYPGLSISTAQLSWQLALAVVLGLYVALTARSTGARIVAAGQTILCLLAMAICGSQGGLVGLVGAAAVVAVFGGKRLWSGRVARHGLLVAGGLVLVVVALVVTGISATSVRGLVGDPDKGFANEVARVDAFSDGTRELVDHPLTGPGQDAYDERHEVVPHFLPLNAGVTAGVLGFAVGLLLVVALGAAIVLGPQGRSRTAWLGLALLSVMLAESLVTPSGPFLRAGSVTLLLLALVACRGEVWPEPGTAPRQGPAGAAGRSPAVTEPLVPG